jgi:hypothetical protein
MTMTKVVIDAQTWAHLMGENGLLELCDPSGRTLGYFRPVVRVGAVKDGKVCSPYTDEELEQRSRQEGARPLAEFWKEHGR